jgi:hypothetical protein
MVIKDLYNNFYACYFENGFEHDLFIDKNFGQEFLHKMSLTKF